MISTDWILDTAVSVIKQQWPEAIYSGFLVTKDRQFDPSTNNVAESVAKESVEIITEKLTVEEIQASGLLSTDLKMYIIGDKSYIVNFDKFIEFEQDSYRVKSIVETLTGSKRALWTIICQK